ncbi:MAG: signal recognition particle-docking protein FtsY [Acidimicrobiia bacterium]|nr:signal recognition particle-docking protein FtsY [Acidimicrobiia bacterium]
MATVIIIAVLAVVLVAGGAYFFVSRSRTRGPELEPPATGVLAPPRPRGGRDTDVLEPDVVDDPTVVEEVPAAAPEREPAGPRPSLRERLARARATFAGFLGRSRIDEETWDELEEALIRADLGVGPTTELLDDLRTRVKEEGLETGAELVQALKVEMKKHLEVTDRSLRLDDGRTNVWLFVGVNGVGKTTSVGKVAKRQVLAGHHVVVAAGDTFRAAAVEQLETWAGRAGADLVRGAPGADPSAIIFDAIESAAAKGADLVLADTAGRLHTKANLMEELRKVRRVADKDPGHVTEVLLVLDATTGQNGLVQARQFTEATEVTGVVLTKLDGSAKGGIVFAIHRELAIPVKLVGLGETADDLVDFDPDEFVDALFSV